MELSEVGEINSWNLEFRSVWCLLSWH